MCIFFVVGVVLYLLVYLFDEGCGESIVFCSCLNSVPFFCFSLWSNGKESIRVRQCLYVAVLCSTGWFDVWCMVLSVVVGFVYILMSSFCVFLVISRSIKFIVLLISWWG